MLFAKARLRAALKKLGAQYDCDMEFVFRQLELRNIYGIALPSIKRSIDDGVGVAVAGLVCCYADVVRNLKSGSLVSEDEVIDVHNLYLSLTGASEFLSRYYPGLMNAKIAYGLRAEDDIQILRSFLEAAGAAKIRE